MQTLNTKNSSHFRKKFLIKKQSKKRFWVTDTVKNHLGTKFGLGNNVKEFVKSHLGYNKNKRIAREYVPKHQTKSLYLFYRNHRHFFSVNLKKQYDMSYTYRTVLIMYNYKGFRLLKGLPVRGQRTRTNANTSGVRNRLGTNLKVGKTGKALSNVSFNAPKRTKYKKTLRYNKRNTNRSIRKKKKTKYFKRKKR